MIVPDRNTPWHRIRIAQSITFPLAEQLDEGAFLARVRTLVVTLVKHEADEGIRLDDRFPFDPHRQTA